MSKHTIKGYVTHEESPYTGRVAIGFRMELPDPKIWPDRIVVCEHSIVVDVPTDFDPRHQKLENLNEQLQTVRAENQQRENAILDQISKLQALTMEAS